MALQLRAPQTSADVAVLCAFALLVCYLSVGCGSAGCANRHLLERDCCAPLLRRLARKARILWCLRKMPTAPGSLGVLLFGHTYALARAVSRYPTTWELFSSWSQAAAPVRDPARWRGGAPRR